MRLHLRERIRRRIYVDCEEAHRVVFDYIEMIYNPTRRHGYNNSLSPVEFEKQYLSRLESVSGDGAIQALLTLIV